MRYDELKNAFGSTPESIKECVRRSLREEQREETVLRRKTTLSLAVALAVIMLLGCAAFAAAQLDGIAGLFGYTDTKTGEVIVNEAALAEITALNEVYEGKAVRFTLTEGVYTPLTGQVIMGWTLETLDPEAEYYILCNEKVGGSWLDAGSLRNVTEYFLKGTEKSVRSGYLTGEGLMTELKFSIMKVNGEIIRYDFDGDEEDGLTLEERVQKRADYLKGCYAEGKLPMAGDGMIETTGTDINASYAEDLVATGLVELVEEFAVSFDLGAVSPVDEHRAYEGAKEFKYDGFEIHFKDVVVTPTGARMEFDYISDEEITQEMKDIVLCGSNFTVPGADIWSKAMIGRDTEPVQMEDGRWMMEVAIDAHSLVVYPEELNFMLAAYDAEGNPYSLIGEAIALKLTEK